MQALMALGMTPTEARGRVDQVAASRLPLKSVQEILQTAFKTAN